MHFSEKCFSSLCKDSIHSRFGFLGGGGSRQKALKSFRSGKGSEYVTSASSNKGISWEMQY